MASEGSAQSEIPFAMVTIADAQTGKYGAEQRFDDDNPGDIVRQRRCLSVGPVHFADLIEPTGVDGVREHGIELGNAIQVPELSEKVICSEQLISGVGAQPQWAA